MAATITATQEPGTQASLRPPSSLRFDWLMLLICLWPLGGALADAWAHINLAPAETFFTPWHDVLYSGIAAVGATFALVVWRNHAKGYTWRNAVAPGYGLTIVGLCVLAVAGVADLIWHSLFGIEKDIAATVSPSHLLIILGVLLLLAGPLRSAMTRPAEAPLRGLAQLPLVLSAALTFTMVSVVTQFSNPLSFRWASHPNINLYTNLGPGDPYMIQAIGLASVLIQAAIISFFVQVLLRRWRLFPGALTLVLVIPAVALGGTQQDLSAVPPVIVAGIVADLLALILRPSPAQPTSFRFFAFLLPAVYFLAYFGFLLLTTGIGWPIHLWLGCIFVSGAIGYTLSLLTVPGETSLHAEAAS